MLARTPQLTAVQLRIPQAWYDALVEVRNHLERGELVHCSCYGCVPKELENGFNMTVWNAHFMGYNCGTVHCIGGWAEKIGKVNFFGNEAYKFEQNYPALCGLFYPVSVDENLWDTISSDQAVQAITNYLTTGYARWDTVLGV